MKIIRRGLLIVAIVVLGLLALENVLIFGVMLELGVPRALWTSAIEFLIFGSLALVLARRAKLWTR